MKKVVLNFISRYLSEEDNTVLVKDTLTVKYLNYGWVLNEQEKSK